MSFTTLRATSIPNFHGVCSVATLSKVLAALAHGRTSYVTAYVYKTNVWITIRNSQTGDKFYLVSESEWDSVFHTVFTDPSTCGCKLCNWRLKRKKYMVNEFKHVVA